MTVALDDGKPSSRAVAFVRQIIEIIVDELEGIADYERIVESITMRILATVQRTGNSEVNPE